MMNNNVCQLGNNSVLSSVFTDFAYSHIFLKMSTKSYFDFSHLRNTVIRRLDMQVFNQWFLKSCTACCVEACAENVIAFWISSLSPWCCCCSVSPDKDILPGFIKGQVIVHVPKLPQPFFLYVLDCHSTLATEISSRFLKASHYLFVPLLPLQHLY